MEIAKIYPGKITNAGLSHVGPSGYLTDNKVSAMK
jgi:hypothetical protein